MAAPSAVTYEGDLQRAEPTALGLFQGKKLWFSRAVPARDWLMQNAELNGAQIVPLEQQADVKLVDHARKNPAPGTHSYKYVELSIRNGRLEDLEAHRVGSSSRVQRPVGSVITASKGGRNAFTPADDQILWDFIKPYMDRGGQWKGNEIYKQIESLHPHHTYQSWRDRWIKYTQVQNRQVTGETHQSVDLPQQQSQDSLPPAKRRKVDETRQTETQLGDANAIQSKQERSLRGPSRGPKKDDVNLDSSSRHKISPSSQHRVQIEEPVKNEHHVLKPKRHVSVNSTAEHHGTESQAVVISSQTKEQEVNSAHQTDQSAGANDDKFPSAFNFTRKEKRSLYNATCQILDTHPDKLDLSWAAVANDWKKYTGEVLRKFFEDVIVPEYKKRNGIRTEAELEAHYKAELRSRQERKARKEAEKEKHGAKQPTVESEQTATSDRLQPKPKSADESYGDGSRKDTSDRPRSAQVQDVSEGARPYPSSATSEHRRPQPNESRKLSQNKGSQSTSSQSQLHSTSQASQRSERQASSFDPIESLNRGRQSQIDRSQRDATFIKPIKDPASGVDHQEVETKKKAGIEQDIRLPSGPPASQISADQPTHRGDFATQISQERETESTDSSLDLQDIEYREKIPPNRATRPESPLFVPEHLTGNLSDKGGPDANGAQLTSSSANVQLVGGGNHAYQANQFSGYAPSEDSSEVIQFESQAQLSQAWETAPDHWSSHRWIEPDEEDVLSVPVQLQRQPGPHLNSFDEVRVKSPSGVRTYITVSSGETTSTDHMPESQTMTTSQEAEGTDAEFETAPTNRPVQETIQERRDEHADHDPPQASRNAVDTQALFQRPTQIPFPELFIIPEPTGGWDDQTQTPNQDPHNNGIPTMEEADYSLLPDDPLLDEAIVPPSISNESDEADIPNWLASMRNKYPSTPSILLKPISYRALESTSTDFDLAETVLARMIQRLEQSRRFPSAADIRKLPKQERGAVVSEVVEELLPDDVRGCWTKGDDAALLGVNARDIKGVTDKHGDDKVQTRFEFLEAYSES